MSTQLGKIEKVNLGMGGYQGVQFGYSFTLSGKGWGVQTEFKGHWADKSDETKKWTDSEREKHLGKAFSELCDLLKEAKVKKPEDLVGVPIEATFMNNTLVDWRILSEVL